MLSSKQRAFLRAQANSLDTILQIGRFGVTDSVIHQVEESIEARELIKLRVLENALLTAREAAEPLAKALGAEVVQLIGTRFVLYRMSKTLPPEKRISLPK